ncbi:serine threonine kinase [Fusarium mexicanum]|uniref:Serine threonine kinase n=1 Tax=Fusarium mexicanum TaxID=751941 RepID=A0A8H5JAZ5_9HYPO|nr:serine threonine kinase [Fusarium mexicanum]
MSTTCYVPPPDQTATQHEGTSSLAIDNTLPRRLLTLVALKTSARFYKHDGPCVPISKSLIVKKGPFVHLTEAATTQFVAANTSIPVPTIHCSFVHKTRAHIVMQRIRGTSLAEAWKTLSEVDLASIFAQLRRMLEELRALVPPNGAGVESCIGGSLRDSRIPRSRPRFGPFKTVQEFHRWLREDLEPDSHSAHIEEQDWKDIKEMIAKQDGPWPSPVFTRGDLNPFNILVRGGQVVGIIDWEFAGWYPYYWEYTSAWLGNLIRQGWQEPLTKFLNAYPLELEMEKTRDRWWGDL